MRVTNITTRETVLERANNENSLNAVECDNKVVGCSPLQPLLVTLSYAPISCHVQEPYNDNAQLRSHEALSDNAVQVLDLINYQMEIQEKKLLRTEKGQVCLT